MTNIILAAGDYFGGASVVGNGNSLTVDDVKFIYHSGLSDIKFKGVDDGVWFTDGVYEYNVNGQMPASLEDVTPVVNGKSATAKVTLDEAFRYVHKDVVKKTTNSKNAQPQHPTLVAPKAMKDIVLMDWTGK